MASKRFLGGMTSLGKRLPLGKSLLGGVAAVVIGTIAVNAVYLQHGKHPAALFAMRSGQDVETALRADEADLRSSIPSQRTTGGRDVTRIVFDDSNGESDVSPAGGQTQTVRAPLPSPTVRETTTYTPETVAAGQDSSAGTDLSKLQDMLLRLGYYEGELDGVSGPKTRSAIEAYKADVGLKGIDLTTEELITSARNNLIVTAAIPAAPPAERPQEVAAIPEPTPAPAATEQSAPAVKLPDNTVLPLHSEAVVKKVQAGLKSFTMSEMKVDGVFGKETEIAISEFQKLFRLPVTGDIDDDLLKKMDAFGLIQK